MNLEVSVLERSRRSYRPRLPAVLSRGIRSVALAEGESTRAVADEDGIKSHFPRTFGRPLLEMVEGKAEGREGPLRIGVVLSGGQAPGGHNVITGLFDAIVEANPASSLIGFLGGPKGIFTNRTLELDAERIDRYRNSGGFDMIGSGRDKIETPQQMAACAVTAGEMKLDGLVIVGGDDSNTNGAVLAEYFLEQGSVTRVVGVPKTIDGDLKGEQVEISFGFDTATKVYAELVGNICRDARSAAKYWHFVKLMGRSASHVTLECGLRTHANVVLIGEEVRQRRMSLDDVAAQVATVVQRRRDAGRDYGVCLVPEGLIEFIPEMRELIDELNAILSSNSSSIAALTTLEQQRDFVVERLSAEAPRVFRSLPEPIQRQLLLDRDSHGNVQVSKIDTELLLIEKVRQQLGGPFQVQNHFFGYEGRCAAPSNFDADYTYTLGQLAATLIDFGKSGYLCSVRNLAAEPELWQPAGVPLTSLMQIETRKGRATPVIAKALVEIDGAPFTALARSRELWELEDHYLFPGALQYYGPPDVCRSVTRTLELETRRA